MFLEEKIQEITWALSGTNCQSISVIFILENEKKSQSPTSQELEMIQEKINEDSKGVQKQEGVPPKIVFFNLETLPDLFLADCLRIYSKAKRIPTHFDDLLEQKEPFGDLNKFGFEESNEEMSLDGDNLNEKDEERIGLAKKKEKLRMMVDLLNEFEQIEQKSKGEVPLILSFGSHSTILGVCPSLAAKSEIM